MKKLLFSLMGVVLCGFMSQAQFSGTIQGIITDASSQPIPGVAVFYYGSHMVNNPSSPSFDETSFLYYTHTDAFGHYSLSYANMNSTDSIVVGVFDCQMNPTFLLKQALNGAITTGSVQIQCAPLDCDAMVRLRSTWVINPAGDIMYEYEAVSLIDSSFSNINTAVTHTWTYNGVSRSGINIWQGPNVDTIIFITTSSQPAPSNVCYQRFASCSPICYNVISTGPTFKCDALFAVDTVNSINFAGQVVMWNNSTTDSGGTILGYHWDFGDGNTSNVQYPTHTYNDTDVYNICLTIVSTDGTDTCTSTFCDSVGFDSSGNLVFKTTQQGFTINVVNPATIGQNEIDLNSHFSLFPNPSDDVATLNWDKSIEVRQIDVVNINGQIIQTIIPDNNAVEFNSLNTGIYILRISSEHGTAALRMMVK